MTPNGHEEARQLLALGAGLSDQQEKWLQAHLAECEACRVWGESAGDVVLALRSQPLRADPRLVRATQMRVRLHASRLRENRERTWLVGMVCFGAGLSASLTAPLVWRLFAWLGELAGWSRPVWQSGFVLFSLVPALLLSLLLWARGTYLKGDESPRQRQ